MVTHCTMSSKLNCLRLNTTSKLIQSKILQAPPVIQRSSKHNKFRPEQLVNAEYLGKLRETNSGLTKVAKHQDYTTIEMPKYNEVL